jgi:uncharacterized protein YdaT
MKWNRNNYPVMMRYLANETRERAIEIANLLAKHGYKKEIAVPVAITKAKEEAHLNMARSGQRYL